ncbi:hypothetical protein ACFY3G_46635 [Streptomyces phaeochromogenes]|uniref:hypothetical protein n=1 Tax=Streptomyces phaeochromogenes TaxID=1923 RepID=UPI0036BDB103
MPLTLVAGGGPQSRSSGGAVGSPVPTHFGRAAFCDPVELLERITARRAELDELEEQLGKQLAEIRAEPDELAVAERALELGCCNNH